MGLLVFVAGLVLVVAGVAIALGGFGWFGRLPGDVRIEGEHTRVYIPIASMVVVSIVLTLLLNLLRRFF